jgi:putative ABC transport system substrate-binding protein
LTAFYRGLREAGVNSLTVMVSYVWANNDYHHLTYLAGELVKHGADVIVAAGGPVSAIAAQNVTSRIPIVFTTVAVPVRSGLVRVFERPDKNATGTWGFTTELEADRMRALEEIVDKKGSFAVLANPDRPYPRRPNFEDQKSSLEGAALQLRRKAAVEPAGTVAQIDQAFARLRARKIDAGLLVTADPFFNSRRYQIVELVNGLGIPAIYQWRGFVEAGGLLSYGSDKAEGYRNAGDMVGQILNQGKSPRDLRVRKAENFKPFMSASKAKELKIKIPDTILGTPVTVLP